MISAAIACEAAKQGEPAVLVLHRRIEAPAERCLYVDRPAGLDRPVCERKRVDFVPRPVLAHDHRVDIKRRARFSMTGVPVTPSGEITPQWSASCVTGSPSPLPDFCAGLLVERVCVPLSNCPPGT